MRHALTALALAASLVASAASAQAVPPGPGAKPARSTAATGQTKPPGSGGAPMKAANEAAMLKAQKASQARDKAWDSKMHDTMGSICRGC